MQMNKREGTEEGGGRRAEGGAWQKQSEGGLVKPLQACTHRSKEKTGHCHPWAWDWLS